MAGGTPVSTSPPPPPQPSSASSSSLLLPPAQQYGTGQQRSMQAVQGEAVQGEAVQHKAVQDMTNSTPTCHITDRACVASMEGTQAGLWHLWPAQPHALHQHLLLLLRTGPQHLASKHYTPFTTPPADALRTCHLPPGCSTPRDQALGLKQLFNLRWGAGSRTAHMQSKVKVEHQVQTKHTLVYLRGRGAPKGGQEVT